MMLESEFSYNKKVLESIPALDKTVVDIEVIKGSDEKTVVQESNSFTIDTILDKISNKGYDSLSKEEKDFLDNKSKNM
jgi:hypothetical protein